MDDADIKLAARSVLFAAVGTAGQRCTTCRSLVNPRYLLLSNLPFTLNSLIMFYFELRILASP